MDKDVKNLPAAPFSMMVEKGPTLAKLLEREGCVGVPEALTPETAATLRAFVEERRDVAMAEVEGGGDAAKAFEKVSEFAGKMAADGQANPCEGLENAAQLERFARAFGLPLFRWNLPLLDELPNVDLKDLYNAEPSLWGSFVEGAPINLTENIKPVRKLVNGSPGILDSLVLAASGASSIIGRHCTDFDDATGAPLQWTRCTLDDVRRANVFQLVELDDLPYAVNVTVGGKTSPPGTEPADCGCFTLASSSSRRPPAGSPRATPCTWWAASMAALRRSDAGRWGRRVARRCPTRRASASIRATPTAAAVSPSSRGTRPCIRIVAPLPTRGSAPRSAPQCRRISA